MFKFVAEHREGWPAVVICGARGVSRSGSDARLRRSRRLAFKSAVAPWNPLKFV